MNIERMADLAVALLAVLCVALGHNVLTDDFATGEMIAGGLLDFGVAGACVGYLLYKAISGGVRGRG